MQLRAKWRLSKPTGAVASASLSHSAALDAARPRQPPGQRPDSTWVSLALSNRVEPACVAAILPRDLTHRDLSETASQGDTNVIHAASERRRRRRAWAERPSV